MAHFVEMTVTDVQKTIREAVVVTLEASNGDAVEFIQGQYLTFKRDFDGTEVRRSYSICTGKHEGAIKVGIKKVEGGAFSTWANEELSAGMKLEVMPPMGNFHTPIAVDAEKNYIGFAGGSGITPVLSILKTVLNEEPHSKFTLVYANRSVNTIMFREEIEDLKNLYLGRLSVVHVLESDAQDIDLFQGRIDQEKCAALFENWIDIRSVDTAFICGPEPMMLGITQALKDHGLSEDKIKFELFASSQPGRLKRKAKVADEETTTQKTTAVLSLEGTTRTIEMDDDETTILEAALENALDVPYACKAGVCSTCKCRLLEGEVEMMANHALEDYEVEQGFILSCQSLPLTKKVVVEYDLH